MSITEVPFSDSEATPPGVQVLSFDALLDRARGHMVDPSAPMRPSFHHLVAVRGGRLDCSVDFTEHQLVEGDLIWVRPGQILQFGRQLETSQGIVVLFAPGFLDDATASAAHADRPDASLVPLPSPALLPVTEMLADEYDNPGGLPAASRPSAHGRRTHSAPDGSAQVGHDHGVRHGLSPIRQSGTRGACGDMRTPFSQDESMSCKKGSGNADQREFGHRRWRRGGPG